MHYQPALPACRLRGHTLFWREGQTYCTEPKEDHMTTATEPVAERVRVEIPAVVSEKWQEVQTRKNQWRDDKEALAQSRKAYEQSIEEFGELLAKCQEPMPLFDRREVPAPDENGERVPGGLADLAEDVAKRATPAEPPITELRNHVIDQDDKAFALPTDKPPAPTPARPWRSAPVTALEEFKLPKGIVAKLVKNKLVLMGDLLDYLNSGRKLTELAGVDLQTAQKIADAIDGFQDRHDPEATGEGVEE